MLGLCTTMSARQPAFTAALSIPARGSPTPRMCPAPRTLSQESLVMCAVAPPVAATSMRPYLESLTARKDLTTAETTAALSYAVSGNASPAEIAAFLALLAAKGEASAEVTGVATAMRAVMVPVEAGEPGKRVLDIVGTGGDGAGTVNISTAASIVAAAAGCRVAKHGNRSVSSKCGSADVLEALGIDLELSPEGVSQCVNEAGIGFMYAPSHHPAMRFVAPVRKALGVRTVFNIAGPLLNPADASCGVIGVYSPALLDVMAETLLALGMKNALVVHSDGLDEFSNTGIADVVEIRHGAKLARTTFDPATKCNMPLCSIGDLKGGDAQDNAKIIRGVLGGELSGPVADAIALNAGVGCYVYGLASSIEEGVDLTRKLLSSGQALKTLDLWAATSQKANKK